MPNPLSQFITSRFIDPIVERRLAAANVEKAAQSFGYGVMPTGALSLREAIGQPTDTDHAILYARYRLNTDVSGCVNRWARGVVSPGWHITTMDPEAKPNRNLRKLIDETETWLKNPHPSKRLYLFLHELVQHLGISGDAFWHIIRDPKTGVPAHYPSVTAPVG